MLYNEHISTHAESVFYFSMCVIYIQVMEPGVCSGSKTIMCTDRAGECEIELESVYSGTPCMYGRVRHCLIVKQCVCLLSNTIVYFRESKTL